ncbi:hypothetical protein CYK37_02225 [Mesorhizobium loti]|nr:hypothetical protein CYK37_02225 [Mesorhizobium loti]
MLGLQLILFATGPAAATVSLDCKGRRYAAGIELTISRPEIAGVLISRDGGVTAGSYERLQIRSSMIDFLKKEARITGIFPSHPRILVHLTIRGSDATLVYKGRHRLTCDWNSIG